MINSLYILLNFKIFLYQFSNKAGISPYFITNWVILSCFLPKFTDLIISLSILHSSSSYRTIGSWRMPSRLSYIPALSSSSTLTTLYTFEVSNNILLLILNLIRISKLFFNLWIIQLSPHHCLSFVNFHRIYLLSVCWNFQCVHFHIQIYLSWNMCCINNFSF